MVDFKEELSRTYHVLSLDQAEMQNHRDIKQWLAEGYITQQEEKELHIFNFKLHRHYRENLKGVQS